MLINHNSVLVIEDNLDTLHMICLMLESEGFEAIAASDSSQALEYLESRNVDVVLVDLMLPEMTGLEFIRHVRRISNHDLTPIIAISAFDQRYLAAAIMAGADAALHKPEDVERLIQTINEVLSRKRPDKVA
jgi:two-component system phosphate regulon response regulator PhoB